MIQFDQPKDQSSILKVIGIGGGGGNAVNYMYGQNIEGVDFIICNTDAQAIASSNVPNKVQLGPHLTQGLGAGANPEIGKEATEESIEEIRSILEVNTKMVFITAGMGGGTGTGGAPIVAQICKELDILTVGIVTTPFSYEGQKRRKQADLGIEQLKSHVDTLLVISNDKLRHQFGNLTVRAAFAKADNVLATAAKCITDVISSTGQINVDFADVSTVMRRGGVAILGNAECSGENRAMKAIEQALNSPLLNDNDIRGAKWILININSASGDHEFTMDEVDTIQTHLLSKAGEGSDVILGLGYDDNLEDRIGITLIATGFEEEETKQRKKQQQQPVSQEPKKEVLELKNTEKKSASQPLFLFDTEDKPVIADNKPEPEPERVGIREEEVFAALKEEEEAAISEELKPGIANSEEEEEEKEKDEMHPDLFSSSDIQAPRKPHIYVERVNVSAKVETYSRPADRIEPDAPQEDDFAEEMKLVERDAVEIEDVVKPTEAPVADKKTLIRLTDEEKMDTDLEPVSEEEDLKRRAMDRISKLRNLSYSSNSSSPGDEYENVPAYLRRNIELHNSIANIESFYKNYTVEPDKDSKIKIGTINTYLNGEKPD